jgi:hypothetical protein
MKILASVFCFILICGFGTTRAVAQGQQNTKTKPDFTGTWLLDRKKSNAGASTKPDQPLKIAHRDPELRITHIVESIGQATALDLVYYTDGRGETNPATIFLSPGTDMNRPGHDKDVSRSKSTWTRNKLIIRSTLRSLIGGRQLEFEVIDEWKLSADLKSLTQTSRTVFRQDPAGGIFVPSNRPDVRRVYNRVAD